MQNSITKIDYAIVALVGFLVGVFSIPVLVNLGIREWRILFVLPLAVPVLFVCGMRITRFLSGRVQILGQIGKFAAVGVLNTAIDFGMLNILSFATGVVEGLKIGGVNIPGFILAVFNSYFWNKFWVFKYKEGNTANDLPKFLAVSIGGLFINTGMVVFLTTFVSPLGGLADGTWLNVSKIAATALSLLWNFLGYKFMVFRESHQ